MSLVFDIFPVARAFGPKLRSFTAGRNAAETDIVTKVIETFARSRSREAAPRPGC